MSTAVETPEKTRKMPHAWPEATLQVPPPAWFQVRRSEDWEPASGRVTALHLDAQGLRLESDISLPRGTPVVVNTTLENLQGLHVKGEVAGSRKEGKRNVAVIRFQHMAESDRYSLGEYVGELGRKREQQPMPVADDRRYRRFVKSLAVEYQVCTPDGKRIPGKGQMVTLDIGGGGFKFRVDHKMSKGDMLYVKLPILGEEPFFSLGRVVWLDKSRVAGRWMAGLQFVDLSATERDRLVAALSQFAPDQARG